MEEEGEKEEEEAEEVGEKTGTIFLRERASLHINSYRGDE